MGEHVAGWLLLGVLAAALDRRRRERWRHATIAVACSWLIDRACKHLVDRERPPSPMVDWEGKRDSPSFPSAHTTVAFAIARSCSPLLPRTPLYLIALTQALARLVTTVHYPSDVAVGMALGLIVGSAG